MDYLPLTVIDIFHISVLCNLWIWCKTETT